MINPLQSLFIKIVLKNNQSNTFKTTHSPFTHRYEITKSPRRTWSSVKIINDSCREVATVIEEVDERYGTCHNELKTYYIFEDLIEDALDTHSGPQDHRWKSLIPYR